jgi:hypothetical protein
LQIIVFPLRLSVNQKGITVDQLIERRKVLLRHFFLKAFSQSEYVLSTTNQVLHVAMARNLR